MGDPSLKIIFSLLIPMQHQVDGRKTRSPGAMWQALYCQPCSPGLRTHRTGKNWGSCATAFHRCGCHWTCRLKIWSTATTSAFPSVGCALASRLFEVVKRLLFEPVILQVAPWAYGFSGSDARHNLLGNQIHAHGAQNAVYRSDTRDVSGRKNTGKPGEHSRGPDTFKAGIFKSAVTPLFDHVIVCLSSTSEISACW